VTVVSLIAAVADNGIIGHNNALPWRIKSEMRYFMQQTLGKPVIMGRKTFESFDNPLQGRTNIVITRDAAYRRDGVTVVKSLDEALAAAAAADEIMIAGGAEIYAQSLPLAQRLYLTEIHLRPEGDTYFPVFDRARWKEVKREFHPALPGETCDYTITVLERK